MKSGTSGLFLRLAGAWVRHTPHVTRRLDGYRGLTAGVLLYLVAFAVVSPYLLTASPARAAFREIDISDDEFEPSEIVVERGDTVVWVHRGARPHGVRASDGSFDSSPGCSFQNGGACMRSGDRYSRTFDQAGTFAYYCPVHGSANGVGMAGQVTVASGGSGSGPTTTAAPPPSTTTSRPAGTTMRPPTSAASTTQAPGGSTTTPPASGPAASPAPPPGGSAATTLITVPSQDVENTTTSLAAGLPINGDTGGDGGSNLLVGIAAAVVLAAAVSMAAWYYRPGARPPGAPPPPPVTPA